MNTRKHTHTPHAPKLKLMMGSYRHGGYSWGGERSNLE